MLGREHEYVADALESGWVSGAGPYVDRFERDVAAFLGLDGGVAVSSGTAALHLALAAAGCGPGDEVIVPALTFVACANAVRYCGARPVFADSDPATWNVTRDSLERVWTDRCRGVLLVHFLGRPAPAPDVVALCRERGAWLVEDCAQSFGATLGGRHTGSFGDFAAFSFYGNKTITTGEGGMVFARDPERRGLLRSLRAHGIEPEHEHWHAELGFSYRMPNTAAAIGCGQIEQAALHVEARRRVNARYRHNLAPLAADGLVDLPAEAAGERAVGWYAALVLRRGGGAVRRRIRDAALHQHGIQTRPFFAPLHQLPVHARAVSLPVAEHLGAHGIMLPTYTDLADAEIDDVCRVLDSLVRAELRG